jgi:hypothetical protein
MDYYKYEDKSNDNNAFDDSRSIKIDYFELDDGRMVKGDFWAESEYAFLSYYFSVQELEDFSKEELIKYLSDNGIKDLDDAEKYPPAKISIIKSRDKNNNEFYVLTINMEE